MVFVDIGKLTRRLFAPDLGLLLAVHRALPGVRPRRWHVGRQRISRRRHLVRVEVIQPRLNPLVFGDLREQVIVKALRRAAVLTAVAMKLRISHSCHAIAE